jgi:DNA-directed RNA polymerase alpha subunit
MDLGDIHVRIVIDTRIIYLLKSSRINTIKELAACTRSTLIKIRGIGPRSLRKIERLLDTYGLGLAGE